MFWKRWADRGPCGDQRVSRVAGLRGVQFEVPKKTHRRRFCSEVFAQQAHRSRLGNGGDRQKDIEAVDFLASKHDSSYGVPCLEVMARRPPVIFKLTSRRQGAADTVQSRGAGDIVGADHGCIKGPDKSSGIIVKRFEQA